MAYEVIESVRPLLAVSVSLAVLPVLVSSHRSPNAREAWTFVAAVAKFLIVLSMLPSVLSGAQYVFTLARVVPGVPIAFRVDSLGMLFALVSSSLWIVTSIYSIGYMRSLKEHSQTRYFCFFALALSATIGVAFSANLLTLYLFYEALSLATYPLVTHHQDKISRASGRKYLFYIMGTSIGLVLPAMLYIYSQTGTLDFSSSGIVGGLGSRNMMVVLLLMLVFGFAKAALIPVHSWLPAAMVAPTPVSALLHAVAVVKVGVFSIVRVVLGVFGVNLLNSLGMSALLCTIASLTVIVASLIALSQDELKRRLAYSTIGQLSYIVLGVGLLSPKGIVGGTVHIAMHAYGKITLFFCAGAIFAATGRKYVSELAGIGRRMPVTMFAFFIGSLSVIGIPLTGGFFSKWYLLQGTLQSGQWAFLVVLLVSSLLNAAYFLPIVYNAFFCPPDSAAFEEGGGEAPLQCVIPLCITALGSVVLFFYPNTFWRLAELAVAQIP
ncbi:monovalent cation/H+ antiporter subunit D family protein [Thermodesulfobacteriota bacterium]